MTRAKYRTVLQVQAVVDTDGTREIFMFSHEDWRTGPGDSPANKPVRGLLRSAGRFSRSLFHDNGVTGRITPDFGYAIVANPRPKELGGAGELDAWMDYSISGCEITAYRGPVDAAVFPDDYEVLYTALGLNMPTGDDIIFAMRDASQLFDQPVVGEGFKGGGGIEGNGAVPKRKQFVSSDPAFFEPILVDPLRNIYFVQSTSTGGLHDSPNINTGLLAPFDVWIDGIKLTRSMPNYSSEADLLASAPGDGVRFWYGPDSVYAAGWKNGPVYFRLSSSSDGDIRIYATGYPNDDDHVRRGGVIGSFTASTLAMRAGLPFNRILTDSELAIGAVLVDDNRTFDEVMTDAALAFQGWYGFDRLGMFRSGYLCDPEDDGMWYGTNPVIFGTPPAAMPTTSLYTFTPSNTLEIKRAGVAGFESPIWSVAVTAGDTYPSIVDPAADDLMKDYLRREVWSAFSGVSVPTRRADPGAIHRTVDIRGRQFQNAFSNRLFMERFFALYGGRHYFWTWKVLIDDEFDLEILRRDLHDVVTLRFPQLGLGAGRKVRIVGMDIDCSSKQHTITFIGWGGTPGVFSPEGITTTPPPTVDKLLEQARIAPFTGYMFGQVSTTGGSEEGGSNALIGPFLGEMIGLVEDAVADPFYADVSLLLFFQQPTGYLVDYSTYHHAITTTNAVRSNTQVKFQEYSYAFDGNDDRISAGDHASFDFGTGDFSVEFWFYPTSTDAGTIFEHHDSSGTSASGLFVELDASLHIIAGQAFGSTIVTGATALTLNAWNFGVVRRTAGLWEIGLNGAADASASSSVSLNATGNATVGGHARSTGSSVTGYMASIRVTKGQSRPLAVPAVAFILTPYQLAIAQYHFEETTLFSNALDSSTWSHSIGGSVAGFSTAGTPAYGSKWVDMDGGGSYNSAAHMSYAVGGEGIVEKQDWTLEFVVDMDASQTSANPCLFRLTGQFGPSWGAGVIVIHSNHASAANVTSIWIYDHSTTVPFMTGTTNLHGAGKKHIKITKVGNNYDFLVDGVSEDTGTFTGDIAATPKYRFIGGSNNADAMQGYVDEFRETIRYAHVGASTLPYPDA